MDAHTLALAPCTLPHTQPRMLSVARTLTLFFTLSSTS